MISREFHQQSGTGQNVSVLVGLATFGSAALFAAESTKKPETAYQELIDNAVARGVAGLQAYVRKGNAKWTGVSGVASVENSSPLNPSQRIRLASITKMITYATVMDLVRRGRLDLSDRAVPHLPPGTLAGIPFANEITVGQLLEHTSGLHNFNGEDSGDFFKDLFSDPRRGMVLWTAAELLAYAKKPEHRPTGKPGEKKAYSSTGYIVLERLIEHREEKLFPQLFRAHLFDPLGMKSAGVEGVDFAASEIVDSYARPGASDRISPSPFTGRKPARADGLVNLSAGLNHFNAWARAAGAVSTNIEDLAKFMDAVVAGRFIVLRDQAAEFARAKQKAESSFSWNGGTWGVRTSILFEPASDVTVIVLTNSSNSGPESLDIARSLLAAARGAGPGH